jgi:peptidyl-prolyl cis-trans isomerase B (cyclophilin B)
VDDDSDRLALARDRIAARRARDELLRCPRDRLDAERRARGDVTAAGWRTSPPDRRTRRTVLPFAAPDPPHEGESMSASRWFLSALLLLACGAAEQSGTPAQAAGAADEIGVIRVRDMGEIRIKFFADKAPGHVKNWKDLARKGFYDGTTFHRVIPGFMIQGGDPNTRDDDPANDGTGDPGYKIKAEFNDVPHRRGIVSMARSQSPDSAGSQFFIVVKDSNFLDRKYTVFGEVVSGMDVADKVVAVDRDGRDRPLKDVVMEKVTVEPAK